MEQIGKIAQQTVRELHQSNSSPQLKSESLLPKIQRKQDTGEYEISLFCDKLAEKQEITQGLMRLMNAFPKMEKEFWLILTERISANEFTSERFKKAIEYVLDNFQYKELNISDIIKFDRRVKLYTGKEFMNAQISGIHPSEFEKRTINDVVYWVRKVDLLNQ